MSNQIKLVSFVKIMFLVLVFLFVGFSANIGTAQAAGDNSELSYTSYKTIYYAENGVFTTTVIIGCETGKGDLYDMNTGKPCPNTKPVLIGCAPLSGDLYDVNTGKPCSNVISSAKTIETKSIAIAPTKEINNSSDNKIAVNIVSSSAISTDKEPSNEEIAQGTISEEDSLSGREKIGRSLSASANKIGAIISGPMSIWIILLIVAIILGGGYGIYNLIKKEDEGNTETPKEEIKTENKTVGDNIPTPAPQASNIAPQTTTVNISKTEGTVSTHSIAK